MSTIFASIKIKDAFFASIKISDAKALHQLKLLMQKISIFLTTVIFTDIGRHI
jgi:hypothetical protein